MNGVHPGPGGDRSDSETNQEFRMLLACNFSASEATGFEYHLSKLDSSRPPEAPAHWAPVPVQQAKPYDQEQDDEELPDDPVVEMRDLADFARGVGDRLDEIVDRIRHAIADSFDDDDEYDGDYGKGGFGA